MQFLVPSVYYYTFIYCLLLDHTVLSCLVDKVKLLTKL